VTSDKLDQRRHVRIDRVPLGVLYMLGATVMFAISSALAKWQVANYSFVEVLFFRAAASLVVVAAIILPRTGWSVFRTKRLMDHAGRSATQATAQSLIIIAFGLMPLAGAVAINFASPLFATLFAALKIPSVQRRFWRENPFYREDDGIVGDNSSFALALRAANAVAYTESRLLRHSSLGAAGLLFTALPSPPA